LEELATITEEDLGLEWKPAQQFGAELGLRSGIAHDERACRADVYNIVAAQLLREEARTEPAVSADVDSSQENDQGHVRQYKDCSLVLDRSTA
jgi:hypothetical protein